MTADRPDLKIRSQSNLFGILQIKIGSRKEGTGRVEGDEWVMEGRKREQGRMLNNDELAHG